MEESGTVNPKVGRWAVKSGQFIQWQDLFVIVDDGSIELERYVPIEEALEAHAKRCPQGMSCLVILPPGAKPPPDDVKRSVKDVLTRLAASLSCLAYVIEGTGFKAAAARASLVSMKIFTSRPYPIFVETSLRVALSKVLPHMPKGKALTMDVNVIVKAISDARMIWETTSPPASNRAGQMNPE
jgi:hypothetical protein